MKAELAGLWPLINNIDWNGRGFSLEKAYACAVFSKLAYFHVPRYEMEDIGRIKVVPCNAYQEIIARRLPVDLQALAAQGDFGNTFTISRQYAIVVGARTRKVNFVAVRGTKYLYDWLINLDARHFRLPAYGRFNDALSFHRGFFRAMASCLEELMERLRENDAAAVPTYLTGHSLGGAMAAIMHAIWPTSIAEGYQLWESSIVPRFLTHSAYTFGMPRYGNFDAVMEFRKPYHIYNSKDIVPSVPPTWFGYDSCTTEFRANGANIEKMHTRQAVGFISWIASLLFGTGVRNHNIELYLDRVGQHALQLSPTRSSAAFQPRHGAVAARQDTSSDLPLEDDFM